MHKKAVLVILLVGILAYANSLSNGFVGDDDVIIVHNTFYKSWGNLKRLVQKDYTTDSYKAHYGLQRDFGSGSVAYRPVLSLTYFLDYAQWKENPFGYHLRNFFLHIFNACLLYLIVFHILKSREIALFGSLLFLVHPIQSEAVCNIGYRADALSAFFAMLSILCFVKYRDFGKWRRGILYGGSLLFFALGIFTKESVVILPAMMLAYDVYSRETYRLTMMASWVRKHIWFFMIIAAYLFLYLKIFPNNALLYANWQGDTALIHATIMARVFSGYLTAVFFPWAINILPAGHIPDIHPLGRWENMAAFFAVAAIIFIAVRMFWKERQLRFFIGWFIIAYIPVSNIISLVSPIAYRFMYFPSAGVFVALAFLIQRLFAKRFAATPHLDLQKMIKFTVIAYCLLTVISFNGLWKSTYTVTHELIKNYPKNMIGYRALGVEYLRQGLYPQAKEVLSRAVIVNPHDAEIQYLLGTCYEDDFDKAAGHFHKAIELVPDFVSPYFGLSWIYISKGQHDKALPYLEKGLQLAPHVIEAYKDLIMSYMAVGRRDDARKAYEKAKLYTQDEKFLQSLWASIESARFVGNN